MITSHEILAPVAEIYCADCMEVLPDRREMDMFKDQPVEPTQEQLI